MKPGVRRATPSKIDVRGHRLALGVHLQDVEAAPEVGSVDGDLAVEPARPEQRGVEDVRPVGGGDQDHAAAYVETVHLDQELVQRLLALVVAAAHAGATVPADGVDLVDEDDRGSVLLRLLEQVADAGGADADEHLDEVRAGDRVERHPGLPGHRAGQQGLAGAGLAVQQDTLGDLGADGLELGGLGQELLDLLELLDRLVTPGDVAEGGLRRVLVGDLGLRLAELHHPAAAALHGVQQEEEQHADDDERDQGAQQGAEEAWGCVLALPLIQGLISHPLVEPRDQLVTLIPNPGCLVAGLVRVLQRDADFLFFVDQDDLAQRLVAVDDRDHLRGGRFLKSASHPLAEVDQQTDRDHRKDDPRQRRAEYPS